MSAPITCHVLNTLSGTPAAGLHATLTLLDPIKPSSTGSAHFRAITDSDGRVKEWLSGFAETVKDVLSDFAEGERTSWSIRFDVGAWYEKQGVETFFPEVEVKFYVKQGERHYHVPLLLTPWSYTTYRGS